MNRAQRVPARAPGTDRPRHRCYPERRLREGSDAGSCCGLQVSGAASRHASRRGYHATEETAWNGKRERDGNCGRPGGRPLRDDGRRLAGALRRHDDGRRRETAPLGSPVPSRHSPHRSLHSNRHRPPRRRRTRSRVRHQKVCNPTPGRPR